MLISGKSFTLMLAALITTATLAILYLPKVGHADQSTTEATESTESNTHKSPQLKSTTTVASPEQENREALKKQLQSVQGAIKRKYEDYLDLAKRAGRSDDNPETAILVRNIADTKTKLDALINAFMQLQSDYMAARRELTDPALFEVAAEDALKKDQKYLFLEAQLDQLQLMKTTSSRAEEITMQWIPIARSQK